MKQRIFMYLFIFSLLLILFQYVNSKQIFESKTEKLEDYKSKIEVYKDSLLLSQDALFEQSYFNLSANDNALVFFENKGFDVDKLLANIKDELYDSNQTSEEEHPIIPYASMTEDKILIDNMRILNHKWIIASFSDGMYGGEMFLTYKILENNTITFNVVESFLYPIN